MISRKIPSVKAPCYSLVVQMLATPGFPICTELPKVPNRPFNVLKCHHHLRIVVFSACVISYFINSVGPCCFDHRFSPSSPCLIDRISLPQLLCDRLCTTSLHPTHLENPHQMSYHCRGVAAVESFWEASGMEARWSDGYEKGDWQLGLLRW